MEAAYMGSGTEVDKVRHLWCVWFGLANKFPSLDFTC